MATTTPPATIPTWATDGGAEITDPGASKRADGFITAEAPAAGHMNHQLNSIGEWVEYLTAKGRGPTSAFENLDWSTASTFPPATLQEATFTYLPGLDRFYWVNGVAAEIFDSADALTWSSAEALQVSGDPIEKDGSLYVTTTTDVYKSTTGLAADLTAQSITTSGTMTSIASIHWDETNSLWILGGAAGSNTCIETSPDLATTFTNRLNYSSGGSATIVVGSPTGTSLCTTSSTVAYHSSVNGTTWTLRTAPTGVPQDLIYNAEMDRFFMATNAATDYLMMVGADGSTDFYEETRTDDIQQIINCYGFVIVVHNKNSDNMQLWRFISGPAGAAGADGGFKEQQFWVHTENDAHTVYGRRYLGSGHRVHCTKPGFLSWFAAMDTRQAISNY